MPIQNTTPMFVPPLHMGVGAGAEVFETKAASFTATAADSGKVFLIIGATAAVNVTLPAIDTGPFHFRVINCSDQSLTLTSVVADTIITFNDLNADSVAFSTSGEKIGGHAEVLCNGTKLIVLPYLVSEAQTVTIATA
jgi:hypothetical protein